MKKIALLFAILLATISIQAQKIETDAMNMYNKRVVTTTWEKVNWKSKNYKLEVSMMLEGYDMSMLLNWQCNEMVGAERDAKIILYFDDASQVVLLNKAFSVSGVGKIATKNVDNSTMGIQFDAKGDFKPIATKVLQHITIETTAGEINFPVTEEEAMELRKMFLVFEKQVYKNKEKK